MFKVVPYINLLTYLVVCLFVVSFGLPYLSVPPSLATFTPPEPAAAATDSDTESAHSNSADVMTRVMSQVIGQIADGQIVS